jgi:hypothetical protein
MAVTATTVVAAERLRAMMGGRGVAWSAVKDTYEVERFSYFAHSTGDGTDGPGTPHRKLHFLSTSSQFLVSVPDSPNLLSFGHLLNSELMQPNRTECCGGFGRANAHGLSDAHEPYANTPTQA